MLMFNNQVELWESMLAIMKLGPIHMPTTTAAGPADLGRPGGPRAGPGWCMCNPVRHRKFDRDAGDFRRIRWDPSRPGG